MTRSTLAVLGAITLSVLGMMLVVGGVLITGLFLPGAMLIAAGLLAFAIAAVLHALEPEPVAAPTTTRRDG